MLMQYWCIILLNALHPQWTACSYNSQISLQALAQAEPEPGPGPHTAPRSPAEILERLPTELHDLILHRIPIEDRWAPARPTEQIAHAPGIDAGLWVHAFSMLLCVEPARPAAESNLLRNLQGPGSALHLLQ